MTLLQMDFEAGPVIGSFSPSRRDHDASPSMWLDDSDFFEGVVSDPLTLQKYMYAEGNPVRYHDPSGHDVGGAIEGAISGTIAAVVVAGAIAAVFGPGLPVFAALAIVGISGAVAGGLAGYKNPASFNALGYDLLAGAGAGLTPGVFLAGGGIAGGIIAGGVEGFGVGYAHGSRGARLAWDTTGGAVGGLLGGLFDAGNEEQVIAGVLTDADLQLILDLFA
jgi:hypothetical protein